MSKKKNTLIESEDFENELTFNNVENTEKKADEKEKKPEIKKIIHSSFYNYMNYRKNNNNNKKGE